MAYSKHKELRKILAELEEQGWQVIPTSNGHFQCRPPDKSKRIVLASAPDERRALANLKADLRRSGAEI